MIDGFAPQPYPLECSADEKTWRLVVGWQRESGSGDLVPLLDTPAGLARAEPGPLRYRPAGPGGLRGARPAAMSSEAPADSGRRPRAARQ